MGQGDISLYIFVNNHKSSYTSSTFLEYNTTGFCILFQNITLFKSMQHTTLSLKRDSVNHSTTYHRLYIIASSEFVFFGGFLFWLVWWRRQNNSIGILKKNKTHSFSLHKQNVNPCSLPSPATDDENKASQRVTWFQNSTRDWALLSINLGRKKVKGKAQFLM